MRILCRGVALRYEERVVFSNQSVQDIQRDVHNVAKRVLLFGSRGVASSRLQLLQQIHDGAHVGRVLHVPRLHQLVYYVERTHDLLCARTTGVTRTLIFSTVLVVGGEYP